MCGLGWLDGLLLYAIFFWLVWFLLGGLWVFVRRVWTGRKMEGRRAEVRVVMGMLVPALTVTFFLVYTVACYHRSDQLPRETAESWPPFAISAAESARSSLPRKSPAP